MIHDHFGVGIKDANTLTPGLGAMYYLQHEKGIPGIKYTPFKWSVAIDR